MSCGLNCFITTIPLRNVINIAAKEQNFEMTFIILETTIFELSSKT